MTVASDLSSLVGSIPINSLECAQRLDSLDELHSLRSEFIIPTVKQVRGKQAATESDESKPCIYLCGNSLGLQPVHTRKLLQEELDVWAESGVHGHFEHKFGRPWVDIDDHVVAESARIVGAKPSEVAIMNSLTTNLHLLMVAFYKPTNGRFKILMESKAFPSDYHAIESQVKFHGYNPDEAIIQLGPRPGEHTLRTEDILTAINQHGKEIALVMFSGVQYYTGQFFDMQSITSAGHKHGCTVGFDLAHAVGNLPLYLHEWKVDFACWCTYKYLNSGPGCIGGAFVHEDHSLDCNGPRFAGWWGSDPAVKFAMETVFRPIPGAAGYRLSNPPVVAVVSLLGSLQVFKKTSMEALRKKSLLLTGYLELLLAPLMESKKLSIITPSDPKQRGCQLSLLFKDSVSSVFDGLVRAGVVCDKREPDVIRIAPAPLYNSFEDVYRFATLLSELV